MGDEQRAAVGELGARHGGGGGEHRDALEPDETRVGDVKGEQRRHRRLDGVAEPLRDDVPDRALVAPGGDEHAVEARRRIVGELGLKTTAVPLLGQDVAHAHAGEQLHPGGVGGGAQRGDDGAGVVGDGKHTPVDLGLQLDPARGEPGNRLARAEAREGPEQLATAARVAFDQLARLGARVGDVATPAAGDAHLGERVRGRLVEAHAGGRIGLGGMDGGEKTGGTTADDMDAKRLGLARRLATAAPGRSAKMGEGDAGA